MSLTRAIEATNAANRLLGEGICEVRDKLSAIELAINSQSTQLTRILQELQGASGRQSTDIENLKSDVDSLGTSVREELTNVRLRMAEVEKNACPLRAGAIQSPCG